MLTNFESKKFKISFSNFDLCVHQEYTMKMDAVIKIQEMHVTKKGLSQPGKDHCCL